MSQQLNDSVAENGPAPTAGDGPKRGATDGGRRTRIVLGLVLWAIALVMGYFVWQASRQLRETMQARAQRPSTQTPPGFAAIPATAAKDADTQSPPNSPSNSSANPPLWDQPGIQDFAFTVRSGKKVTTANPHGHSLLVSLIFTPCVGPCPKVSGRTGELELQLFE